MMKSPKSKMLSLHNAEFKDGYLDFSHLTKLKYIYITEIYMTKRYKSSTTKNHKITKKNFFDGVPLQGYVAAS